MFNVTISTYQDGDLQIKVGLKSALPTNLNASSWKPVCTTFPNRSRTGLGLHIYFYLSLNLFHPFHHYLLPFPTQNLTFFSLLPIISFPFYHPSFSFLHPSFTPHSFNTKPFDSSCLNLFHHFLHVFLPFFYTHLLSNTKNIPSFFLWPYTPHFLLHLIIPSFCAFLPYFPLFHYFHSSFLFLLFSPPSLTLSFNGQ